MDTVNLRDFTSFCWNFCHLGLALVKSPQIMQTGSQILTELGHTTSIKKQPVKWMAHINETATQNQLDGTYQWNCHTKPTMVHLHVSAVKSAFSGY
jgi:hypothetical protein